MNTLSHRRSTPSSCFYRILFNISVTTACFIAGSAAAYAGQVTLGWDKSTDADVAGYKIYYGTSPRNYTQSVKISSPSITTCTILNLADGQRYYFAATAYTPELLESDYSAEISALSNPATTTVLTTSTTAPPATSSSTSSVIATTSVPATTIRPTTSTSTSSIIPTTSIPTTTTFNPTTTTSAAVTTTTVPAVYFGNNSTAAGFDTGDAGYSFRNVKAVFKITGAGTYNVKSLAAYFRRGTARLAIYDSSGNFIMQGNAAVSGSWSAAWNGHTQFVDQSKTPIANPQLQGETNYILIVSFAASPSAALGYTAGSSGDSCSFSGNYSSGYPATIGSGASEANLYCIRCLVQYASAEITTTSSVVPATSTTTSSVQTTTSSSSSSVIPTTSVPTTTTTTAIPSTTTTESGIDSDNDGIPDARDNCPNKPNGPNLGTCTPGSDKPGTTCQRDTDCANDSTGAGRCSLDQEDSDGDGAGDACDNCPSTCNAQQLDADKDGIGDVCDDTPGCGGCSGVECEQEC